MIGRTSVFAIAVAALAGFAGPAAAQSRVEVGGLRCEIAPSVSFIVGSVRDMRCVFRPSRGGPAHRYAGRITRIGLDVGFSGGGVLGWAVFAPTHRLGRGDLVGNYAGASAGAAVGVGVGANALVGGSRNTIALQPLSGEVSGGLGLAAGVAGLSLR